jgi:myo-inositol-1(or 4)-monophosphatase
MTDLCKASRTAEQAAYAAGLHLQASRSRLSATIVTKGAPHAVAADIGFEAELLMREVIARHFPRHAVVARGEADAAGFDGAPHWFVQPLDGHSNYLRDYPQYAVSIAFVEFGEPQLGVVFDPNLNEFFGAIRGRGAVLNGEPIRCGPPRPAPLALATTVFTRPDARHRQAHIGEFGRVSRGFGGVRRSDSRSLALAHLAAGRIDAFWEHGMTPCEAAAGVALLRETGALAHARDGRPVLDSASLLACKPALFEPFLSLLADA